MTGGIVCADLSELRAPGIIPTDMEGGRGFIVIARLVRAIATRTCRDRRTSRAMTMRRRHPTVKLDAGWYHTPAQRSDAGGLPLQRLRRLGCPRSPASSLAARQAGTSWAPHAPRRHARIAPSPPYLSAYPVPPPAIRCHPGGPCPAH